MTVAPGCISLFHGVAFHHIDLIDGKSKSFKGIVFWR
jgi:hypothetical protein